MSTTTRTPSAYAIQNAMAALTAARERLLAEDASMPEDQQLWADMLDGTADGDPLAVIDRLVQAAIEAADMAEVAHVRATELAERKARFRERNARLRAVVHEMMAALELRRLERAHYTASVRAGQPRVVITDETAIPPAFLRVVTEPKKAEIGAALKAGEQVAGTLLNNAPDALAIRTR